MARLLGVRLGLPQPVLQLPLPLRVHVELVGLWRVVPVQCAQRLEAVVSAMPRPSGGKGIHCISSRCVSDRVPCLPPL